VEGQIYRAQTENRTDTGTADHRLGEGVARQRHQDKRVREKMHLVGEPLIGPGGEMKRAG
jgi:hypothetical protein